MNNFTVSLLLTVSVVDSFVRTKEMSGEWMDVRVTPSF